MFHPLNTEQAALAQQLFQAFPGFVQHHQVAGLGAYVSYLIIIIFVSASLVSYPSVGLAGEISVGIQISWSQPELAAQLALPEPCLTSLVLPSPASNTLVFQVAGS